MAQPRQGPTWHLIGHLRRKILARLPRDRFLRLLIKGCMRVGRDAGNPLRGNFVASGLREAIGHVLHSLAPDDEVRACVWFVQAKDTKTVTRLQKASYIVRAGLPDDFVKDKLNLDEDVYIKPLLKTMDELHKATHVRENTVVNSVDDVKRMLSKVLTGIDDLLATAEDSRRDVTNAIVDVMHDAVFQNLIADTIQDLDELSTHTTVDDHYIDTVEVIRMDAQTIEYAVTGQVEVELQYGSDSDVRNDIGMRMDDAYPYTATARGRIKTPMELTSEDIHLSVDNSSFYE